MVGRTSPFSRYAPLYAVAIAAVALEAEARVTPVAPVAPTGDVTKKPVNQPEIIEALQQPARATESTADFIRRHNAALSLVAPIT